jgi:hypothetical protein
VNGTNHTTALVPAGTMQVDANEVKTQATFFLEHAKAGSPAFPRDLTPIQASELARVALAYGLDPIMGELTIYQGKIYVGIDGRTRKATEHPAYDGMECVPATDAERRGFRCSEDEHLWICRVYRKDMRFPFVGYGRAGGAGDRNPVSKTYGQEMAQKRAKHRALRDAFSIPLPGSEESDGWQPPTVEPMRRTDYGTGEIIDAEAIDLDDAEMSDGPTRDQLAAIHIQVKALGWTDDQYRGLLRDAFGVESSTSLSEGQASALLESIGAIGEAESASASLSEVRARMSGVSAADLMSGLDDYQPPPPEPEPAPVIDAPATRLATKEQINEIQRTASPSAQKTANWDTLTYEAAEEWIDSLRQRR